MSVFNTGSAPQLLWPGLKRVYGETYKEKPLIAGMVFEGMSSDKAYEKMQEMTGLGLAVQKAEMAGISYDVDGQGYTTTFNNVGYGLGVQVSHEAIQDNQYQSVAERKMKKLARSMRLTKETVAANIFNRAFNSSYVGGDGLELCSTAHVTADGTQANEPTVAVDFSEAALEDMLTAILQIKDSRGYFIQANARKLLIPPALRFEAQRILGSALQAGSANNDVNAIRSMGILSTGDVIVWPYLTDTDAWFVLTDVPDSLIMFNRQAASLTQDNDFDTMNVKMKSYERYSIGWADWRGVRGSPGA